MSEFGRGSGEVKKKRVKTARRQLKRRLARLDRGWWGERIEESREVCDSGRIGEIYSLLRKIGRRGKPAEVRTKITASEFKEYFEEYRRRGTKWSLE